MKESNILMAVARNRRVRILMAETTKLCEDARLTHDLYPTSNAAMGRVLSVAALMGAMLKRADEKVTIEINGGGPIGTILVEARGDGNLKGFVGDNTIYMKYNSNNKLAVGLAVGTDGYIKVAKNMGLKNIFTSQIALQTGEIGEDFAYYFTVSEQIPSLVSVGVLVDTDYSTKSAGAIIIEMLPGHTDEDIEYVENAAKKLKPVSEMMMENTPEEILDMLFEDAEILERREVRFHCDCSKERFMEALLTLNKSDLEEVMKDDMIELKCEYCNTFYHIGKDELMKFIEEHVEN